ncbi:MAG: VCBS repeat-containing protein [Planctomycetia bacterium]|nr:VCBS repeat-containing protein [Planctomycetia bacterium]
MKKVGMIVAVLFFSSVWLWGQEEPKLERMLYHHPGLVDDLSAGLWSWPVLQDVNGDGNVDILISCPDTPYRGLYYFESYGIDADHPGLGTPPASSTPVPAPSMPLFKPGKRLGDAQGYVQASYLGDTVRVLIPGAEILDIAKTGFQKKVPIDVPLPGQFPKWVDFNGDGVLDYITALENRKVHGWDNAYDANGVWKNPPPDGAVFVTINQGTNEKPVFKDVIRLKDCLGKNIRVFGWPSPNFADFDGDGDLDLLCGEFLDRFTYYENIGTKTEPKYTPGVFLRREDGSFVRMDLQMGTAMVYDWNRDGHPDLIASEEDSRLGFHENAGTFREDDVEGITVKSPVFREQRYFQQEAHELNGGSLVTPCCVDWDGDGAIDLLCGNAAGYILFFKNLSKPGVEYPRFARPVYCQSEGKPVRILAGENGSIQGPIEAKWGYTTISVADWDGDGLLDIMWNNIVGTVGWFRNIGTKTEPKLDVLRPVEVEWDGPAPELAWGWMKPKGKELLTQWRTTPVMFDVNADGLMDLCMLDTEGYFAFFERYRDGEGNLKLKSPQRIFCWENGTPLRLNQGKGGGSGRRKFCMGDFNGDGKFDILANSMNVEAFYQVKAEDGKYFFKRVPPLDSRKLAGHSSSPALTDFNNDGTPDVVVGAEDGRFYYMRNPNR